MGHTLVTQDGRGYGMGVISGIKAATGELLTFMDADGSYDPAALPRMLELIDQGNDIVFCSRYLPDSGSDDDTAIRALGNWVFTFLLRTLFGVKLSDALFFYALGRRELFEGLDLEARDFSLCVEIPVKVHKAGYRYAEIPLKERTRIAGVSKVNALWDGLSILAFMVRLKLKGY
jgi:glycosyltransferase involved in cell wall biosynthesis